jgi:phosphatidylglycerol:prolipoprotein diacylglycerol transferase
MLTYPNIDPVLISLGSLKIHWYGLMYLAGFSAAWCLGHSRALQPRSTWTKAQFDQFLFYGVLGALLGGRLGFVLFYGIEYWHSDWLFPFKIWDGGMSFHGGLCGVVMAYEGLALRQARNIADVLDFASPLVGPGIFFVRIGNFINGELWGKPTNVPWAFMYQGVPRHASQLYEAGLEGIVLGTAVWIFSSKPKPRFASSGLFLVGYGAIRFFLEFIRIPDANRGYLFLGWVTEGQMLSVPMIVAGIILLLAAYRFRTPTGNIKDPIALPPLPARASGEVASVRPARTATLDRPRLGRRQADRRPRGRVRARQVHRR